MELDLSVLLDFPARFQGTDVSGRIRTASETPCQQLIDSEATAFIGAAPFQSAEARTSQHNGAPRTLSPTAGDLNLKIPKKLRHGSFFHELFEQRRIVDQALYAVVRVAYRHEGFIRRVETKVKALGADTGI